MQVCNKLATMEKETFKTNLTTLFTSAITGLFLEKKTSQKNKINYTDLISHTDNTATDNFQQLFSIF